MSTKLFLYTKNSNDFVILTVKNDYNKYIGKIRLDGKIKIEENGTYDCIDQSDCEIDENLTSLFQDATNFNQNYKELFDALANTTLASGLINIFGYPADGIREVIFDWY